MRSFRDIYRTDRSAMEAGVWVQFPGGTELRVRSTRSEKYAVAESVIQKRNEPYFRTKIAIPPDIKEQNIVDAVCALVADWKGPVPDVNGAPMTYSEDNARALFSDPDMWELRDQIVSIAMSAEAFRRSSLEEAAKNSAPVASPTSGSAATAGN